MYQQPYHSKAFKCQLFGLCHATIAWLLIGQNTLEAQAVTPLVTPQIVPLQDNDEKGRGADVELGFSGVPQGENTAVTEDELFIALPEDPNAPIPNDAEMLDGSLLEDLPIESLIGTEDPGYDINFTPLGFGDPAWQSARDRWSRGFAEMPGSMPYGGGMFDQIRDGFALLVSLGGTYDTNPSQGYTAGANSGGGDFFTTLGGTVNYLSRGSIWTYGARYSGGYNQYFNQSELSGYNQSAGASLNYDGGSLTVGLNLGVDFGSGANRYYGSVVDEISYNYGLNARYRISSKTSLAGNFSQSLSNASGGGNTGSFNLGVSALWHYSPLTEFGPGIRYTSSGGSSSGQDRTSIGPTMTVNYKLAQKVSLNSQVGMDFVKFENGGSGDPSFSTSIGLNYRASSLWGINLLLQRDARASYTGGNEFEEVTKLRLGYNRKIRRVSWTLGMGLENTTSDNPEGTTATRPDRNYLSFDTALSMPVFADTCNASIFMRKNDQSGGGNESWDSLQMGFNISRSF